MKSLSVGQLLGLTPKQPELERSVPPELEAPFAPLRAGLAQLEGTTGVTGLARLGDRLRFVVGTDFPEGSPARAQLEALVLHQTHAELGGAVEAAGLTLEVGFHNDRDAQRHFGAADLQFAEWAEGGVTGLSAKVSWPGAGAAEPDGVPRLRAADPTLQAPARLELPLRVEGAPWVLALTAQGGSAFPSGERGRAVALTHGELAELEGLARAAVARLDASSEEAALVDAAMAWAHRRPPGLLVTSAVQYRGPVYGRNTELFGRDSVLVPIRSGQSLLTLEAHAGGIGLFFDGDREGARELGVNEALELEEPLMRSLGEVPMSNEWWDVLRSGFEHYRRLAELCR